MNSTELKQVFQILTIHAKANPLDLESFLHYMEREGDHPKEFRFMGSLGMGGKLCAEQEGQQVRYRVSAYPEDMTRTRKDTIKRVNELLAELIPPM